jgi:acyl dehydratase
VRDAAASISILHHEDLVVGQSHTFGRKAIAKEEIIAFGRRFDPQPMHLDEEAAKASIVGGLCASGYHVCGILMRLVVDGLLHRVASLGSPGVDEVKWIKPVRPGDVLTGRYTVQEKRVLASRPDVGVSKVLVELLNDKGEVVSTWITNQLTRVRQPKAATAARRKRAAMVSLWAAPPPGGAGVSSRLLRRSPDWRDPGLWPTHIPT